MNISALNAMHQYALAKTAMRSPESAGSMQGAIGSPNNAKPSPFEEIYKVTGAIQKSEAAAAAFMTGSADPHSVVEAIAAAELAVETAVTVRDKVVEAYQELIRMPV